MQHWRDELPDRFAQIDDPETFFSTLGQQVATEIADLSATLAEQEPSTGEFLANLGDRRTAKLRAEEIVLAQRIYLTEETDEQDNPASTSLTGTDWIPLTEDPSHPWWQAERENNPDE
jgi:hypothetical protein